MTIQETGQYDEGAMRAFVASLFAKDPALEDDGHDDGKEAISPEPEPADTDQQFTRLIFTPTEGH